MRTEQGGGGIVKRRFATRIKVRGRIRFERADKKLTVTLIWAFGFFYDTMEIIADGSRYTLIHCGRPIGTCAPRDLLRAMHGFRECAAWTRGPKLDHTPLPA